MFNNKFLKEFLCQKDLSLFVFKGWKNQRKIEYLGYWVWSSFLSLSSIFLKYFSLYFIFQTPWFLTLELSYLSYLYNLIFSEKIGLWSIEITKVVYGLLWSPRVVIFFLLWVSLLCRGDCGGCVWLYWYLSKCRDDWGWSFDLVPYPSKCRGNCYCLALCLSL